MNLEYLQHLSEGILQLKPPVVLLIFLNILGFALKRIKWFPNDYIGLTLILTGGFTFPLIFEKTSLVLDVYNPLMYEFVIGCFIGGMSVALYETLKRFNIPVILAKLLKKFLSTILPGLGLDKLFEENEKTDPPTSTS